MIVKDELGQEIEVGCVYGKYDDDIQLDEIYYLDETLGEVSDDTIEYIMDTYASEIYDLWYENKCGEAESYWEGDR